jgi:hypothetical protein
MLMVQRCTTNLILSRGGSPTDVKTPTMHRIHMNRATCACTKPKWHFQTL